MVEKENANTKSSDFFPSLQCNFSSLHTAASRRVYVRAADRPTPVRAMRMSLRRVANFDSIVDVRLAAPKKRERNVEQKSLARVRRNF